MSKIDHEMRVGIFVKQKDFRLVEIDKSSSGQFRINKLIQATIDTKFDYQAIQNDSHLADIGNKIFEILNLFEAGKKNIIFTIESPLAMIKKIPMDDSLSQEELIDHVHWEVKQFSYSPDDEYIVDFQKINAPNGQSSQQIIVVSVRERIIQQLKKLFAAAKLLVKVVELDIFAAIRAIENNYDLKSDEVVSLIDVDSFGMKFTILKDKNFFFSQEIPSSKLGLEKKSLMTVEDIDLARLISRELRRIVQDHQLGDSIESVDRIFLYGDLVKDGVLENLQNNYSLKVDKTNPIRNLFVGPKVHLDEKISSHPEALTVCIGSALR